MKSMSWGSIVAASGLGIVSGFVTSPIACILTFLLGLSPPMPSAAVIFWLVGLVLTPIVATMGGFFGAVLTAYIFKTRGMILTGGLIGGAVGGIIVGVVIGSLGFPVGQ